MYDTVGVKPDVSDEDLHVAFRIKIVKNAPR